MNIIRRLLALTALTLLVPFVLPTPAADAATQHRLLSVTVGHHATYDRVVFTFSGTGVPSHSISYVSQVIADPSGKVVPLLGNHDISVALHGIASANVGAPAFQGDIRPGFPQLREVKGTGDFEGVVSFGVGVTSRTTFRVSTLSNPSRLVLDLPIASGSSSTLPATGASNGTLATYGLVLLATGAVLLAVTRRRELATAQTR